MSDAVPTADAIPTTDTDATAPSLELNEELRYLFAAIQDYAIYTLTPEGMIHAWNPGAERLHGYTREKAAGKYFGVLYPKDGIDVGSAEFQLKFAAEHGRYIREGWQTRQDGTRFWAYCVTTAMRDESGRLRGFAKVSLDITQRKQASGRRVAGVTRLHPADHYECAARDRRLRQEPTIPRLESLHGAVDGAR